MKKLPWILSALVTISVLGTALALASDGQGPESSGDDPASTAVERIAPGLSELVAAFRRGQTSMDIAHGSSEALTDLGDRQPGEEPSLSRRLDLPEEQHAYLWPMRDGLCWSADLAGGCAPLALLREHGALIAFSTEADKPGMWIFVRARDGIDSVSFRFPGGGTVSRKLEDNGLIAQFDSVPVEATWRNVDGKEQRQVLTRTAG
jgi:hypothetical protein